MPMLRLSIEQLERLETLALARRAAGAGAVLAQAFPAVTQRLGERFAPFVEAALQQGQRHGIEHVVDLAGYAGLWCLWGAGFDAKPGFEWARDILADPALRPGLKVHQLRCRSREELRRRQGANASPAGSAPGSVTLAEFDAGVTRLDSGVAALAAGRAVFEAEMEWTPVCACDIASLDLRIVEPADRHEYRYAAAGWQRVAAPSPALPDLAWSHVDAPPTPLVLLGNLLRGGTATRINLKLQMHAVCDPRRHAEVVHTDGIRRLAWHGRDAARLALSLYAASAADAPGAPGASDAIAAVVAAPLQSVEVTSCGQRDAGAAFGAFALGLQVHPSTQRLLEVQHPAWLPMAWPNADAVPPPVVQLRFEADGVARPAAPRLAAWQGLQGATRAGLARLFEAWGKAIDGESPRLDVQAAALMGQAGITWGWQRLDAATLAMRCEGVLDLVACALDLGLAGELVEGGARSRIRVACKGRSELRATLASGGEPAQALGEARRSWRFPFAVELEPLAVGGIATLSAHAAPDAPAGAIVGECGLRPCADGIGWQWFFSLRVEPLTLATVLNDPLLGVSQQRRVLLPAMTLVDWCA